ncbi:MAG: polysaccharide deacetylase family protein, partial [Candidatus Acidiferrum sp.]
SLLLSFRSTRDHSSLRAAMFRFRTPRTTLLVIAAAAASFLFAFAAIPRPQPLRLAFTFDDLPAHGPLPPGETRLDVANKILAALRAAHLLPVYGFVNGASNERESGGPAVLEAWRKAGNPLGNHTWSHMNLNQNSVEDFEANIARNEPLLAKMMNNQDWRWLRFPYLAEGDTPEKRDPIRAYLAQHGYKIAGVTMSFSDYLWNEPYARCMAKGDSAAVAQLKSSYLAAADQTIPFYRGLSKTLYNRDIPYVLLMHVGALDAELLPQLLDLYRSRGFQFVTLAEAERDRFYNNDLDPRLSSTPDTLEEAMAQAHLPLPAKPAPSIQLDSLCR